LHLVLEVMSSIKSSSSLEKVAGSLSVEAALTAIAAAAGTPLAALLPILGKSLAGERQKQRVEATLLEMNNILAKHEAQLATLTDQQYKIINETVLALLHTTNESKMDLLRNVVQNSLSALALPDQEAIFLSRIIRDISAEEAQFLIVNFGYERIWLNESKPEKGERSTLAVKPNTTNGQVVLGLITLGLVSTAEPTWDDSGLLRFTPLAAKLIVLLRKQDT
jgi:hypothetical protein